MSREHLTYLKMWGLVTANKLATAANSQMNFRKKLNQFFRVQITNRKRNTSEFRMSRLVMGFVKVVGIHSLVVVYCSTPSASATILSMVTRARLSSSPLRATEPAT